MHRGLILGLTCAACIAMSCSDSDQSSTDLGGGQMDLSIHDMVFDRNPGDSSLDLPAFDVSGQDHTGHDAARPGDASKDNPTTMDQGTAGFSSESGFTVSGSFVHGGQVTVHRGSGGLGSKNPAPAWIWDTVDRQLVLGVNQDAYQSVAEGGEIPQTVWTKTMQAGVGKKCRLYRNRPLRHGRLSASYGTVATDQQDNNVKAVVGNPTWPYGSVSNTSLYVSWWQKVKYGYGDPGHGGSSEDKVFRLSDSAGTGAGSNYWSFGGLAADTVANDNRKSWKSLPSTTSWVRFEVYADMSQGHLDAYYNGALWIGSWSGAPGEFEFRPAADYLYVNPPKSGFAWAAPGFINVRPNMIGYDDAGTTTDSNGQEVDISEIYVDITQARLEISEQASWSIHQPSQTVLREVQGEVLTWSDQQLSFVINQGGFSSLSGKFLYVILGHGQALKVGQFQ